MLGKRQNYWYQIGDSSTTSFPESLILRPWERRCVLVRVWHFPSRQVLHVRNKENMMNISVMASNNKKTRAGSCGRTHRFLWTIYQTLLKHRELPVTRMIPRFSRASIPSQTVTPCNLTLTILSVGLNHPGSYWISPSVNTRASPGKNHLHYLYY